MVLVPLLSLYRMRGVVLGAGTPRPEARRRARGLARDVYDVHGIATGEEATVEYLVDRSPNECLIATEVYLLRQWPYPGIVVRRDTFTNFSENQGCLAFAITDAKGVRVFALPEGAGSRIIVDAGRSKYANTVDAFYVGDHLVNIAVDEVVYLPRTPKPTSDHRLPPRSPQSATVQIAGLVRPLSATQSESARLRHCAGPGTS